MKNRFFLLQNMFLTFMLLGLCAQIARADILTFDDIIVEPLAPYYTDISDGYGGFNWSAYDPNSSCAPQDCDFSVLDSTVHGGGYLVGATSGENVAFNKTDSTAVITRESQFNFVGAFFTSAWVAENLLSITAYRGGDSVDSLELLIVNSSPTWIDVNFTSIDRLEFSTSGSHFAMDDFSYNLDIGSVPEPSTLILLVLGLAGLVVRRKSVATL